MFAKGLFRFLLSLLLFATMAAGARAQPVFNGTTNASAVLGGVANPALNFDFGAGYGFLTLDLSVTYDATELGFNPAASFLGAYPGLTLTLDSNFDGSWGSGFPASTFVTVPGSYTASYGDLFDPTATLAGAQSFAAAFTVLPGLAPGASSAVAWSFTFGNTSYGYDTFDSTTYGSFEVSRVTSPIPEPGTYALLLGGLGLLALARKSRWRAVRIG